MYEHCVFFSLQEIIRPHTFDHAKGAISAILDGMSRVSKPVKKMMSVLFPLWWSISGRRNFTNAARYGEYGEQSLRHAFARGFDFFQFNLLLLKGRPGEKVLTFDPSYVAKSGKRTYGLGRFWSGKDQCAKKGLEIGCLAVVDVEKGTALQLAAYQTPPAQERKEKSLVGHYVAKILEQSVHLLKISHYLTVDGYFMKKDFILPMLSTGLQVITKMRQDANLYYPARQQKKTGKRGRPKQYEGKVQLNKIDKRRWTYVATQDEVNIYTAILYCVALGRQARIVYLQDQKTKRYQVLLSTDIDLDAQTIISYYRLRFQIEFLIRDAKQHAGLEECQARSKAKLDFHFNLSMTSVSLAKMIFHITGTDDDHGFSMQSINRLYHNKLLTDKIFSILDIELSSRKIRRLYRQCLDFGALAA